MRILVTGADGQLGRCIRDAAENSSDEYLFTDVDDLDICDAEAVALSLKVNCFDVVVNCAAFTDVERAELQEDIAMSINNCAVRNIADAARDNGVTLIHISTDYVFDGSVNQPITESHIAKPCSAYGRTKLAGELSVAESGCKAIIIRTSWLYSEYGKNFVKTIHRLSDEIDRLNVVVDQIGSPTYARDLAETIVKIVSDRSFEGREGIYHYSDEGVCSWYDLAKITVELSANVKCKVQPCRSSEYPSNVNRPAYSVLDKTKIKSTFGLEIPYWIDSLRQCINRINNTGNGQI